MKILLMYLRGKDEVSEGKQKDTALKYFENKARQAVVKVDRAAEPLKKVDLIHPILHYEDEGSDGSGQRSDIGVERHHKDVDYIVGVPL